MLQVKSYISLNNLSFFILPIIFENLLLYSNDVQSVITFDKLIVVQ